MRRTCLLGSGLAALLACGGQDRARDQPSSAPVSAPLAVASAPTAPPATVAAPAAPPRPAVHSTHANAISMLGVTDDGTAAVTADGFGGVRLWPTLDGKQEPWVVHLPQPLSLAITRAADDFVIAGLDGAGTVQVTRMTAAGEQRDVVPVALDVAAASVVAVNDGFLAQLADGRYAEIDRDAAVHHVLVVPPGHRAVALLARRGAALAVLADNRGELRGRWIELGSFAWASETPPLPIDAGRIALSPDHTHIAGTRRGVLVSVDLATGARTQLFDPASDTLAGETNIIGPFGYAADDLLVFSWHRYLVWLRGTKQEPAEEIDGVTVVAGGAAIVATGTFLGIVKPGETKYLGYRIDYAIRYAVFGAHVMVCGHTDVVVTDAAGRVEHRYPLKASQSVTNIRPLDLRHVLVERTTPDGHYAVSLLTLSDDAEEAPLDAACMADMQYEPATGLLACRGNERTIVFARYDRRAGTLSAPVELHSSVDGDVKLLDPAHADGLVALRIDFDTDTFAWPIKAVHTDGRPVAEAIVEGERFESRSSDPSIQRLMGFDTPPSAITRSRAGSVAKLVEQRLSLRRGKQIVWEVAAPVASDIAWTPDGDLVVLGGGVSRVDLTTGALVAPHCGFGFGLWPERPQTFGTALLCEEGT